MSDFRDKIERLLREYRCQYTQDDDGNGSKLVDVFTPLDYMDIGPGKREVHLLADMLAAELSVPPEGGRTSVALGRAAYALFQLKRFADMPQAAIDFCREEHSAACAVLDGEELPQGE